MFNNPDPLLITAIMIISVIQLVVTIISIKFNEFHLISNDSKIFFYFITFFILIIQVVLIYSNLILV